MNQDMGIYVADAVEGAPADPNNGACSVGCAGELTLDNFLEEFERWESEVAPGLSASARAAGALGFADSLERLFAQDAEFAARFAGVPRLFRVLLSSMLETCPGNRGGLLDRSD